MLEKTFIKSKLLYVDIYLCLWTHTIIQVRKSYNLCDLYVKSLILKSTAFCGIECFMT